MTSVNAVISYVQESVYINTAIFSLGSTSAPELFLKLRIKTGDSFINRDDARALCPGQSLAVLSGGVQSSSICSSAPGAWLRAAGLCDWSFGDRVSQGNVSCLALKVPCD